jgi:two-component system sensor histidine kinase VicK
MYMENMVRGTLTRAKIDSGQFTLWSRPEDLPTVIAQSLDRNRLLALSHEIEVTTAFPMMTLSVDMDRPCLDQVLNNLIADAIKFSPQGSTVTVGFTVETSHVRIFVGDAGTGVPEAERKGPCNVLPAISKLISNEEPANGLGLYTADYLVQAHGGVLGLECPPAGGITFWFSLPLQTLAISRGRPRLDNVRRHDRGLGGANCPPPTA